MKKYRNSLFITALLLITSSTFATTQEKSKLPVCPSVKVIRTIAFDTIEKGDTSGVWTLHQTDQTFKTDHHWKFSLMLEANSKDDALKKGKKSLSKLHKIRGPEKVDKVWICDYESKNILSAVAMYDEGAK